MLSSKTTHNYMILVVYNGFSNRAPVKLKLKAI